MPGVLLLESKIALVAGVVWMLSSFTLINGGECPASQTAINAAYCLPMVLSSNSTTGSNLSLCCESLAAYTSDCLCDLIRKQNPWLLRLMDGATAMCGAPIVHCSSSSKRQSNKHQGRKHKPRKEISS